MTSHIVLQKIKKCTLADNSTKKRQPIECDSYFLNYKVKRLGKLAETHNRRLCPYRFKTSHEVCTCIEFQKKTHKQLRAKRVAHPLIPAPTAL